MGDSDNLFESDVFSDQLVVLGRSLISLWRSARMRAARHALVGLVVACLIGTSLCTCVAAGTGNASQTLLFASADGNVWTSVTSPFGSGVARSVAFGGRTWVAAAQGSAHSLATSGEPGC